MKKSEISKPNTLDQSFLSACVESSNDAIMLTDEKGVILYVNPAWRKIYGYSEEEALGKNPRLLRSGHHSKEFYAAMWSDILNPEKGYWKGEVINTAKGGAETQVLLTISPCRNAENRLLGYMSISVDISERKRLESQLQWSDRLAAIGTLTSGMAHELGTPLGIIRGRAELMKQSLDITPEESASLQAIIDQSDRVSTLMHSLQNLSRLSPTEIRFPVSLKKASKDVENLLRAKVESLAIRMDINIPEHAGVLGEPGRLEYALLNLCINSLHAIERLKKEGQKKDHFIELRAIENHSTWEVSVSDSGGGISPENVPHLFKPFFTTKEVGEGRGLGLAMIHQVISSWGGSIQVENKPGIGATFIFRLPKA